MADESEIDEGHVFRHHDHLEEATPGEIEALDLDDDGKVSLVEMGRAQVGIVDAKMEELAERGGVTGKLAGVAHKVLDAIDNDDSGKHDASADDARTDDARPDTDGTDAPPT